MIQNLAKATETLKEMGEPVDAKPPYTRRDVLGATVHGFSLDSGMGPVVEYHYATTLQDADIVTGTTSTIAVTTIPD